MTTYIQRFGQGYRETVDEFESCKEARKIIEEYRISDPSANYYLSQRPCNDWLAEHVLERAAQRKCW